MEMVKGSILDPFAVTATLTLLQVVGHIPVPHIVPPPPQKIKTPKTGAICCDCLRGGEGDRIKRCFGKEPEINYN